MQQTKILTPESTKTWPLRGWALWSLPAIFYAYEFLHRVVPSVLTVQLREAFNVNDYQLGVIGAMYFYAYAAFQLPAGILIDRYGAKNLLVIASAILTLGSFIFASTDSILWAHISRFMVGMGSAFAFVGCLKIGSQWLSTSLFPLIVGLTNLCGTLGALSGGMPFSYWIEQVGWREVLIQVSYVGLFITLLMWLFIPSVKEVEKLKYAFSGTPKSATLDTASLLKGLKKVMRSGQSWLVALYGALLVAPIAALPEMWGVEYLQVAYNIPATQAATVTHIIFIGTAIGGPLLGMLIPYFKKEFLFMRWATIGALVLLSAFIYGENISLYSLYFLLFFYGIFTSNMLFCFSYITKLHPGDSHGAAIGFTNMVIMIFAGIAQQSVGWLLQSFNNYHIALSILPLSLCIAILLTFTFKKAADERT